MSLTKNDLQLIKETLQPEFDGVEKRIKESLQPEFAKSEKRIKESLAPEFAKSEKRIKESLAPEFAKLEKKLTAKINTLRRENRKDHNTIINNFDRRDIELKKRVSKIEACLGFPTYHSL